MEYEIVVHELAVEELASIRPFDQRRLISEIREQLANRPGVPTRRRKCLVNLVPGFEHVQPVWELRVAISGFFMMSKKTKVEYMCGPCGARNPHNGQRI